MPFKKASSRLIKSHNISRVNVIDEFLPTITLFIYHVYVKSLPVAINEKLAGVAKAVILETGCTIIVTSFFTTNKATSEINFFPLLFVITHLY